MDYGLRGKAKDERRLRSEVGGKLNAQELKDIN
jgi:hypothetical protein